MAFDFHLIYFAWLLLLLVVVVGVAVAVVVVVVVAFGVRHISFDD